MIHDIAEDYTRELLASIQEKLGGEVFEPHSISAAEIEDPTSQKIEEAGNQP